LAEDLIFDEAQKTLKTPPVARLTNATNEGDRQVVDQMEDRSKKAKAPKIIQPTGKFPTPESAAKEFELRRNKSIAYVSRTRTWFSFVIQLQSRRILITFLPRSCLSWERTRNLFRRIASRSVHSLPKNFRMLLPMETLRWSRYSRSGPFGKRQQFYMRNTTARRRNQSPTDAVSCTRDEVFGSLFAVGARRREVPPILFRSSWINYELSTIPRITSFDM
jgi:hypothetical protein